MSLVSLRNLAAPLQSKVQLGALIIAALLVLVIRLGGGSASGSGIPQERRGDRIAQADDEALRRSQIMDLLSDTGHDAAPSKAPARPEPNGGDDMLDGLVDGRFDKQLKQQRQNEQKGESFEDIRRSLGLE